MLKLILLITIANNSVSISINEWNRIVYSSTMGNLHDM